MSPGWLPQTQRVLDLDTLGETSCSGSGRARPPLGKERSQPAENGLHPQSRADASDVLGRGRV